MSVPTRSPARTGSKVCYVPEGSRLIAMVKISGIANKADIAIKADQISALPR